jgi:hypothetical protein
MSEEQQAPERAGREGDTQPLPKAADGPIMHEVVIQALQERLAVGIKRYGQPLRAFNGRDAAQDAFEEVLDLSVYLAQAKIEMQAMRDFLDFVIWTFESTHRAGHILRNNERLVLDAALALREKLSAGQ